MEDDKLDGRSTALVLLASLTLLLGLLSLFWSPASLTKVRADSAGLFLVDHDGDASGQPCTSGSDEDCSLRRAIEHANSSGGIFVSSTGSTPSGARAWIYGNVVKYGADRVVIGDDRHSGRWRCRGQ
jgi:hypothetical protein